MAENVEKNAAGAEKNAEKNAFVQARVDEIFAARAEFFAALDAAVVKGGQFRLSECEDAAVRQLWAAFFKYDYGFRKLMPVLRAEFGASADV